MQAIKTIQLDDKVVYEPATHSLYKMGDRQSQVTLAIPASLCFLVLLQNKGNVVTHDEMLSFAWGARGITVSSNTVYQNLSLLRKSLESVGLPDDVIKTIPKRGWVIPDDFLVEFIDEFSGNISGSDEDNVIQNENFLPSPPSSEHSNDRRQKQFFFKFAFFSVCSAVLYFSYQISNYLGEDVIPDYIAPDYIKIESTTDCHILRNMSLRTNDFFTKFISEQNLKCDNEKWWYIINYPPSHEISLFRCSGELDKTVTEKTSLCTSDFYSGN